MSVQVLSFIQEHLPPPNEDVQRALLAAIGDDPFLRMLGERPGYISGLLKRLIVYLEQQDIEDGIYDGLADAYAQKLVADGLMPVRSSSFPAADSPPSSVRSQFRPWRQ